MLRSGILPSFLLATLVGALPAAAEEIACPEGTTLEEREQDGARDAWCARPDGVLHGPYRSWHANGQRRSETRYENGVEHGTLRAWHDRPLYLIAGMMNSNAAKDFLAPLAPLAAALYAVAIPGEANSFSAE